MLVAAPTGSGKTLIAEFAATLAVAAGGKLFYTTPIKALSNQKFGQLCDRFGAQRVGLLTGDNSVNAGAPIVVMTTEVLRNMLYGDAEVLAGLRAVVLDEVHYLADRARGAVWEEVIIHLPTGVQLVSLSATVSNTEEFADWLLHLRGDTEVVVSEVRPVPLVGHMLVGNRLYELFARGSTPADPRVNPYLLRLAQEEARWPGMARGAGARRSSPAGHRAGHPRLRPPGPPEVLATLDDQGLLPAIVFIFSRAGCDGAVRSCLRAGLRLAPEGAQALVDAVVERRTASLTTADLAAVGYDEWRAGLAQGVAAHHAGMLPAFREAVEELFARGLLAAVFATETLALGIHMPARTVVLERLVRFDGQTHVTLTPGEYTQLTGRAGRRGIDVEGHAVVLWSPEVDPRALAGLASTRTYPLRSSFSPSYAMVANLLTRADPQRARELLARSFAQHQANRSVAGLTRQLARTTATLAEGRAQLRCSAGDLEGYLGLRAQLAEAERHAARSGAAARRAAIRAGLSRLRPGDVLAIRTGRRPGLAVVIESDTGSPSRRPTHRPAGGPAQLPEVDLAAPEPRLVVLGADRRLRRLTSAALGEAPSVLGQLRLPRDFAPRSARSRRDLAASLRTAYRLETSAPIASTPAAGDARPDTPTGQDHPADESERTRLRAAVRAHPCHRCPRREEHLALARRLERLHSENAALAERVAARTTALPAAFDRRCAVLAELGYVEGGRLTPAGRLLARLTCSAELLVAECLRAKVWEGLSAPDLAACVATLVHEPRRDEPVAPAPAPAVQAAVARMSARAAQLAEVEAAHRLPGTPPPAPGLAWACGRWASGDTLAEVLAVTGGTAGDFVRGVRRVADLLDTLASALSTSGLGDPELASRARLARASLLRGAVRHDLDVPVSTPWPDPLGAPGPDPTPGAPVGLDNNQVTM